MTSFSNHTQKPIAYYSGRKTEAYLNLSVFRGRSTEVDNRMPPPSSSLVHFEVMVQAVIRRGVSGRRDSGLR